MIKILDDYKSEITGPISQVLIYFTLLFDCKNLYQPIKEYIDENNFGGKKTVDNMLMEELPDNVDELDPDTDIQNLRDSCWKYALSEGLKHVVRTLIKKDGVNIVISSEQLFRLYEIGIKVLYEVSHYTTAIYGKLGLLHIY